MQLLLPQSLPFKTRFLNRIRSVFKLPVLESLLVAVTHGRSTRSWIAKLPANPYQYKDGSIRRVKRDGLEYELDISHYREWLLYFGFRQKKRKALLEQVRAGQTVLDVGAGFGDFTLSVATKLGNSGRVLSFEADVASFQKLEKNIGLNQCQNVQLYNLGLCTKNSSRDVYLREGALNGMGHDLRGEDQPAGFGEIVTIKTKRLDEIVEEINPRRIDIIRIRAGGDEIRVLRGAEMVLETFRPMLFIEVNDIRN